MDNIFDLISVFDGIDTADTAPAAPASNTVTSAPVSGPCVKIDGSDIRVYTFDPVESRYRVEDFFELLRNDYDDYVLDLQCDDDFDDNDIPSFEDWLESLDDCLSGGVLGMYARHWFSCVAYDEDENVDENMDIHFGEESCFGYCHNSSDISIFNIRNSVRSFMMVYHGSAHKFDTFKKHVNHQFGYCGAVETGYSTSMDYCVAYRYAMMTPPGVDETTGIEYGHTRYMYSLNFVANYIDMPSIRGAWELEPYKDLLVYFGVQVVNINKNKESVILDETLMADFTVGEMEYDEVH